MDLDYTEQALLRFDESSHVGAAIANTQARLPADGETISRTQRSVTADCELRVSSWSVYGRTETVR